MNMVSNKARVGFSLLEVQVALAILVVAALGLLSVFMMGIQAGGKAQFLTTCAFLAHGKMQEIAAPRPEKGLSLQDEEEGEGKFPTPFDSYAFTVTSEAEEGSLYLRKVTVRVDGLKGTHITLVSWKSGK